VRREIERTTLVVDQSLLGPARACDARLLAFVFGVRPCCNQGIRCFCAPDSSSPDFGIAAVILFRILLAQPRVQSVIPGPERYVADPWDQILIETDARRLQPERIQSALLACLVQDGTAAKSSIVTLDEPSEFRLYRSRCFADQSPRCRSGRHQPVPRQLAPRTTGDICRPGRPSAANHRPAVFPTEDGR
jgi:hypothetical protein